MNICNTLISTGLENAPGSEAITINSTHGIMTLSEATKFLPRRNGKRVNVSTLWRWCRKGIRGEFLQYCKIGRTIYVSVSDLNSFFVTLAQADRSVQTTVASTHRRRPRPSHLTIRQKEIDDANAVLIRAGILKPQSNL